MLDYLSPQGLYYGTDLAEEAVAFCRRRYRRPNFFFLANGITSVPIDGAQFDFIFLGSVFTHMFPDEIQALLMELRRLLAPGGMIVGDLFLADDVATFAGGRGMVEINEAHLDARLKATGLAYEPLMTWAHNEQVRRRILKFTHPAAGTTGLASEGARCEEATMAKMVLPRMHVMVLCDEIEPSAEEAEVFDLRGVRTYIAAPAFPYAHPQLCVYLQLTGHEGTASGEIRIVLAETDDTVYRQEVGPVPFVGPLVLVPLRQRG